MYEQTIERDLEKKKELLGQMYVVSEAVLELDVELVQVTSADSP